MIIICDICKQPIASIDPNTVHAPITGDQLHSPRPAAGIPSLIHNSLPWVDMRCIYCHKRPFIQDDLLTTVDFKKIQLKPKKTKKANKRGK